MSELDDQAVGQLLSRTRRTIMILVAVPAGLLLLALLCPARSPRDAIAVLTALIWFVVYPLCMLCGLLAMFVPLRIFSGWNAAPGCRRRIVAAVLFSLAALVVVCDLWYLGVFAGQKSQMWLFDFVPAAVALLLAFAQIPTRFQMARWSSSQGATEPGTKGTGK
jgi:hypothetical protein